MWSPFPDDRQVKIRKTFHIFMSSSVFDVKEDVREDERVEADDMTIVTKSRQQFIRFCWETHRSCPEHKRCEKNRQAKNRKRLTDEKKKLEFSLQYVTGWHRVDRIAIAGSTWVNRSRPDDRDRPRQVISCPREELKECPLRQSGGSVSERRARSHVGVT